MSSYWRKSSPQTLPWRRSTSTGNIKPCQARLSTGSSLLRAASAATSPTVTAGVSSPITYIGHARVPDRSCETAPTAPTSGSEVAAAVSAARQPGSGTASSSKPQTRSTSLRAITRARPASKPPQQPIFRSSESTSASGWRSAASRSSSLTSGVPSLSTSTSTSGCSSSRASSVSRSGTGLSRAKTTAATRGLASVIVAADHRRRLL